MDHPRKILIYYASAGHGHEKAARAVEEALRERPELSVFCLDALDLTPGFFGKNYKGSYLFMIKSATWLWGFLYGASDVLALRPVIRPARAIVNSIFAKRLEKMIELEQPETVLATHFMPVEIAARLKRKGKIRSKIVSVITDFLPHEFWIAPEVDIYAVAHDRTRAELVRRGVPESRIRVTGIPVGKKFMLKADAKELRTKLRLEESVFTALVTSGGAGVGDAVGLVERLKKIGKPVQTLAVCGTNKALFAKLSPSAGKSLKVYSFVNNMDELMQISDVVVGKSGGLTVSESLAVGLPMIVLRPVPGQEERNAVVLDAASAGFVARSTAEAALKVRELAEFPEVLAAYRHAARAAGRPFAARDVAEIACER